MVVVDPADLSAPARIAVQDLDEGSWVLRPLLGDVIYRTLGELVRERNPDERSEGIAMPGPLGASWEDVARLGTLLWIEQWSPLPLDRSLLDIDIAAASDACRALGAEEEAAVRYRRCSTQLLEFGERLAKGPGLATAPELCTALLNAPRYLWNLPATESRRLNDLVTAAAEAAAQTVRRRMHPAKATDVLKEHGVGGGASTAGDDAPDGTFSVDWHMVPPGLLDPRENTIMTVYKDRQLTVTVRAAHPASLAGQRSATGLKFRVLADGTQTSAGILALDGQFYRGSIEQKQKLAAGAVVDVFADGPTVPPPTQDRDRARIRRLAAWALAIERLAATRSDDVAQELWLEAAARWDRVTEELQGVSESEDHSQWQHAAEQHQAACSKRAEELEQANQSHGGIPSSQEASGGAQTGDPGRPSLAELALAGALPVVPV